MEKGAYDFQKNESSGLKKFLFIVGLILFLVGIFGWGDRFIYGHLHANYGNVVTWGLWVALYIYFIGLSAGSFLISSMVYVFNLHQFEKVGRISLLTAVITLILALLSIVVDLGHMFRSWHVVVFPNFKSPMAWMIWLYSFYFLIVCLELWLVLRVDIVKGKNDPGWRGSIYKLLAFGSTDTSTTSAANDMKKVKVLASIGIPVAIMFHGGVGALFGVVAARPHWHSGLFPILFLLSALVSGGALLIVISAVFQNGWTRNRETIISLGKLVLGLLLLDCLFQFSEILIAFRGGIPGHTSGMETMMFGPYWWVFWVLQLGLGTAIPIYLLASNNNKSPAMVTLAGLLIATGFIGLRLNIVIPGLAHEEIQGLTDAFVSARYSIKYFPSTSEFMLSAGIFGLGILLFSFFENLLPTEKERV